MFDRKTDFLTAADKVADLLRENLKTQQGGETKTNYIVATVEKITGIAKPDQKKHPKLLYYFDCLTRRMMARHTEEGEEGQSLKRIDSSDGIMLIDALAATAPVWADGGRRADDWPESSDSISARSGRCGELIKMRADLLESLMLSSSALMACRSGGGIPGGGPPPLFYDHPAGGPPAIGGGLSGSLPCAKEENNYLDHIVALERLSGHISTTCRPQLP